MPMITVWTRQHVDVLKELKKSGRHAGSRDFVEPLMPEYRQFTIDCYEWLAKNVPLPWPEFQGNANEGELPVCGMMHEDELPVWVQTDPDATYYAGDDGVVLRLRVDESLVCGVNVAKWGIIQNFGYIPLNEADRLRHVRMLKDLGINDVKAYTTPFYPEVKAEILASWPRLFDRSVKSDSDLEYGIMREIRSEWIEEIIGQ